MSSSLRLNFQRQIFTDILTEDGLVVVAKGLGLLTIFAQFVRLYSCSVDAKATINHEVDEITQAQSVSDDATFIKPKRPLVIVLNFTSSDDQLAMRELLCVQFDVKQQLLPQVITNEVLANERADIYKEGGVLFITSRILVVDLLNNRLPVEKISGILIHQAHAVTETSVEAFIMRLYRQKNSSGFIKAFSDFPESLVRGFSAVEKVMKLCYVRKLYLWPRFHMTVAADLEERPVDVIELRQPMTANQQTLQRAILDVIDACLSELKQSLSKSTVGIDTSEFTLDQAMFKSFDALLHQELDPVWHRLSSKAKQLVSDLKTLRRLLIHLTQEDSASFYHSLHSIWTTASLGQPSHSHPTWFFTAAADVLMSIARDRVFSQRIRQVDPVSVPLSDDDILLEENPKWHLLINILQEIEQHALVQNLEESHLQSDVDSNPLGPILIMTADDKTCIQLSDLFNLGGRGLLKHRVSHHLRWKSNLPKIKASFKKNPGRPDYKRPAEQSISKPVAARRRQRTAATSASSASFLDIQGKEQDAAAIERFLAAKQEDRDDAVEDGESGHNSNESREHEQVDSHDLLATEYEDTVFDASTFDANFGILSNPMLMFPYTGCFHHMHGETLLDTLQPSAIILYDADPWFIRQVEMYCAQHPARKVFVYMIMYEKSTEEQRYMMSIRRENDAFERLIRAKAMMSIPLSDPGSSATGQNDAMSSRWDTSLGKNVFIPADGAPLKPSQKIVVDVREFRSSLPSLIHQRGIQIVPVTMEIGDYLLAPEICVERKSIPDLIGSFQSGRLFMQIEAMSAVYPIPVLLIEFEANQSFELQSQLTDDVSVSSISSKLTLLMLHFPSLRMLWSSSPYHSAEMFEELKRNREQPDESLLITKGSALSLHEESAFNMAPVEMLQRMPGVTSKNYRLIIRHIPSIEALCRADLSTLEDLMGRKPATALHHFLHQDIKKDTDLKNVKQSSSLPK